MFVITLITKWLAVAFYRLLKWNHSWQVALVLLLNSCLNIWISFLIFGTNNVGWFALIALFNFCTIFSFWFIIRWFTQSMNHLEKLNQQIKYDQNGFLNSTFAHHHIHQLIQTQNLQFGLIIIFELQQIDFFTKEFGISGAKTIKQTLMHSFKTGFSFKNQIFYRLKNGGYACFLPIDEQWNPDWYHSLNEIKFHPSPMWEKTLYQLKTLPEQISFDHQTVKINLNTAIGIYGIQDCDLNLIEENCQKTLANLTTEGENMIRINNEWEMLYQNYSEQEYQKLSNLIPNDQLWIEFKLINQQNIPVVSCILNGKLTYQQIIEDAEQVGIKTLTIRYLAQQILFFASQKELQYPVVLPYSFSFVNSSEFVPEWFLNRLKKTKINPKQIILELNGLEKDLTDYGMVNLHFLKRSGIKIIFQNQ